MCLRAVRVETVSRSELVLLVYPRTRRRKSRADPGGRPVGLGPVSFPCCRIALMAVAGPWAPTVVLTPRTDHARRRCRAKSDRVRASPIRDCIQGLPAACPVQVDTRDGCAARRQVVATHVGSPCATWARARGHRAGPVAVRGRAAAKRSVMWRTASRQCRRSGK